MFKLKNEKLSVLISPHGAEIKEIKYNGIDLLHDSNPAFWNRSAPYLFPNIGTIKDKYTLFNNQKYPLTKHGFIRDVDFELVKETNDELILKFMANDETKKMYPFDFEFIVQYQLIKNEIFTKIKITNLSKVMMPFNLGLHPAFKIPFEKNTNFEDYRIVFDKSISFKTPTVDLETGTVDFKNYKKEFINIKELHLNHEDYQFDALVIKPYPKEFVKLVSPNNSEIIIKCAAFKELGIWTPYPKKAPFICLEPWIGYADGPNSDHDFLNKEDLIKLQPNDSFEIAFSYEFKIK